MGTMEWLLRGVAAFSLLLLVFNAVGAARPPIDPHKLVITDRTSGWRVTVGAAGQGASEEGQITWRHTAAGAAERQWTTEIANTSATRRCMAIAYHFTIPGTDYMALFPSATPEPQWPQDGELAYAYVRETLDWTELSIPFASLADGKGDVGISLAPDLGDMPIPPFEIRMAKTADSIRVLVRRPEVRLEGNGKVAVRLFAASHGGDTREGLAWMRGKWPGLFMVPGGLAKFQWSIWAGSTAIGLAKTFDTEQAFRKAFYNIDPHLWKGIYQIRPHPWYGLNISDFEPWENFIDDKWFYFKDMTDLPGHPGKDAGFDEIVKFVEGLADRKDLVERIRSQQTREIDAQVGPRAYTWGRYTHDDVRTYGKRIKDGGFQWMYYWNPNDMWKPYGEKVYPGQMFPDLETWIMCSVIDPLPGSQRARDIMDEAERLFDTYPAIDGLFMDQVYYALSNPRGDDGISIKPDGTPFSRHQWNTYRVIKQLRKLADTRGKVLQANFIFNSLEIASLTDLGLIESEKPLQVCSWFYDIGNRLHICQQQFEHTLQDCVVRGWQAHLWGTATHPGIAHPEQRQSQYWQARLMRPLMMLFQERTLVLEPDCLELPTGFEGNVYRQPRGNYVVPIIVRGASHMSPYCWSDVNVVVRLEDAARIQRVYQLASDRAGPVVVPFERDGGELHIKIPRHRSTSALVLAQTGKFVALADDAIARGATRARLVEDDVDRATRREFSVDVEPASHEGFALVKLPARDDLLLPRVALESDGRPTFELRVEPKVAVTIAPSPECVQQMDFDDRSILNTGTLWVDAGRNVTFTATVRNHSDQARKVEVSVTGKAVDVTPADAAVDVAAAGRASIRLNVVGESAGRGAITIRAGSTGSIAFDVIGRSLEGVDLASAERATLVLDKMAATGGKQEVFLNGVEAGMLGLVRIDRAAWDYGGRHELANDALSALKETNRIEIETGKASFTVRNLSLEVALDDGRLYRLAADPTAQSAPPDWLQACGRRIPSESKMQWALPSTKASTGVH